MQEMSDHKAGLLRRLSTGTRRVTRTESMLVVLFLLMGVMTLVSPHFLTGRNLLNVAVQSCILSIVAIGTTYVLISGGIDLSIGAVAGLVGVLTAGLVKNSGVPEIIAIIAAFSVALIFGLFNGWIITRFRLDAVVVTLGTWNIARGLVQVYVVNTRPTAPPLTSFLGSESIRGVPVILIITVVIAVVSHLILTRTVLGRRCFAIGGNPVAARLSGVPVARARMTFFVFSAFYAAMAGLLMTGRLFAVDANAGAGLEFAAPAAAVVGGTSLYGGRGSVTNAVIGALILGVIANGLNLTRVNFFWQQVAVGGAIILAVSIDTLRRRRAQ